MYVPAFAYVCVCVCVCVGVGVGVGVCVCVCVCGCLCVTPEPRRNKTYYPWSEMAVPWKQIHDQSAHLMVSESHSRLAPGMLLACMITIIRQIALFKNSFGSF